MESERTRRSPRLALELPIRVFGFDYQGIDFVEDAATTVVAQHGAKIWLGRNLILEQEIRILCHPTHRESVFRVVCRAAGTNQGSIFWGVECLEMGNNIWGIDFPDVKPRDQRSVRMMVQCPECRMRELLHTDERLVEVVQEMGGLLRNCRLCGKSGLWKTVPYAEA
jgi:hypothetical protein